MKPMKMPSLSRRHLLIISLYSLQFRNSLERRVFLLRQHNRIKERGAFENAKG
jgi:hypothetical protein